MSSAAIAYRLSTFTGRIRHGSQEVTLVRDGDYRPRYITTEERLEAEVRSGDYFVTLATVLDSLSGRLDDYEARLELESIISDLIYLQDSYQITKTERQK